METPLFRSRYRYFRRNKGWRVLRAGTQIGHHELEFLTFGNEQGTTRLWQRQILDPSRGWTTIESHANLPRQRRRIA